MTIPIIPNPLGQAIGAAGEGVSGFINARNQKKWKEVQMAQDAVNRHLELVNAGVISRSTLESPEFVQQWMTARYGPSPTNIVPDYKTQILATQAGIAPTLARQTVRRGEQDITAADRAAAAQPEVGIERTAKEAQLRAARTGAGIASSAMAQPGFANVRMPGTGGRTVGEAAGLVATGAQPFATHFDEIGRQFALLAAREEADDVRRFMEDTEHAFSRPFAKDIVAGRIEIVTPPDTRPSLRSDIGKRDPEQPRIPRTSILPRAYRVDPRTGRRTPLGTLTAEQVAALQNRTETPMARRRASMIAEGRMLTDQQKLTSFISLPHDDPTKVAVNIRVAEITQALANPASTALTGAGSSAPTSPAPAAPVVAAPAAPTTSVAQRPIQGSSGFAGVVATATVPPSFSGPPDAQLVGYISSYSVNQEILSRVLDHPGIIQLTTGPAPDLVHARNAALSYVRVNVKDRSQLREAEVAINGFYDQMEAWKGVNK